MNPYFHFVSEYARFVKEGKTYPLGGFAPAPRPTIPPGAPKALIFSPHPDDEVIIGGLALRLMREAQYNVINVAVTQGSNKARQQGRYEELKNCCANIGFGLIQTAPNGLEKINPKARQQDPSGWEQNVKVIAEILKREQPKVILFPHDSDWNSSHIGTHYLVADAMKMLGDDLSCYCVETEFWGAMTTPNLMVEMGVSDLSDLMTALSFHIEEVRRNPYHMTLPAWMADNVRRGGEVVGGQGGAAPDFTYATLYRLRAWRKGQFEKFYEGGKALAVSENPAGLFPS